MPLVELLTPSRVACAAAADKDAALARVADLLEDDPGRRPLVLDALRAREEVGSTGLGHGVAVPHARLDLGEDCRPAAAFLRLQQPLPFGAPDGEPVDLILALNLPRHCREHLELLAEVTERLGDADLRARLRQAPDAATTIALLHARPLAGTVA
ncbi:PTS sugar transporter subunit IIA [Coralloluteibacterium stylophorae]|uniref:PTS sugar transporter subunit IIA n=1 Tax=Coralloluteibacterium stylophorae TaxID=1776034 RepID=A0A8J8AZQ0_9GAMM|nr:PTS sugar transporter subunit IIA [Coralloluteibacterium stylophorae]MBS7456742.1 PTS sugar transporter subunit IIA [Coralloluteibacterium stylophorae]